MPLHGLASDGFTLPALLPVLRCALTALTLTDRKLSGGLFSVALS